MRGPMAFTWTVIGVVAATVVGMEALLWGLFARRVRPLLLAHELDASSFGMWTMGRLKLFMVIHTCLLAAGTSLFLLAI